MSIVFVITFSAIVVASQGYGVPNPRIWDGKVIPIEEMPWMIQVETHGVPLCGGAILSEDFILTSAQCTINGNNQYRIRAGTGKYNSGGSVHHVKYLYTHPDYDTGIREYSVAVAKVDPPFVFDATRQPIRLGLENPAIGSIASIAGWGKTKEGEFHTEFLVAENVTVTVEDDVCEPNGDLQFCATGSFCSGDWGVPFVQDGFLLGVASVPDFCHTTNTYTSAVAETNRNFIIENAELKYN